MSDTTTAPTSAPAQDNDAQHEATPKVDETDWKAEAKKWETRAKENKTAAGELASLKQSQMSDLEKANKVAQDALADAEAARADALRYRIATRFQVTDEDAELFLTGRDEETLTRQAERLVDRNKPGMPKPDPSQGARGGQSPQTTGDLFAAAIEGSFTR